MKLPSKVRFADIKLQEAYESLQNSTGFEKKLHGSIKNAFASLEKNAFSGTQIQKKLIPKEYIRKYRIDNLWKYNLLNGWRLIYYIKGNQTLVLSVILDWLSHADYEKKLKY
jgi:hypothetical protein